MGKSGDRGPNDSSRGPNDSSDPGGGLVCWFCPTCHTLTLWESAERGECAQKPAREDCYLQRLRVAAG